LTHIHIDSSPDVDPRFLTGQHAGVAAVAVALVFATIQVTEQTVHPNESHIFLSEYKPYMDT
jgi:hypothetical protein